MRNIRLTHPLAKLWLATIAISGSALATAASSMYEPPASAQAHDMVDRLDRLLKPTDTQKPDVDRIVGEHEAQISAIRSDTTMSKEDVRARVRENLAQMASELKPLLTREQNRRLGEFLRPRPWFPTEYEVYVSYEAYLPTDPVARNIFGNSPSAFGLGFQVYQPDIPAGLKVGWSVDFFSLINGSNSVFVLAPQITAEQYEPIGKNLWAFGKLSAGPAYFDYAFDMPDGRHFGAKRFGGDGSAEVGLRYGPVELAANYRLLTQPVGVNFSGVQLSLTWYVFHFRI